MLEQLGKSSICLVKNISTRGVQLKCYSNPVVDAPASLRVADERAVDGRIVWTKNGFAGMSFLEELDAATFLRVQQKLRPHRRRSVPRVEVEGSAILRTGGKTYRAAVCDISSVGARVRTTSPLKEGDRAIVELPDLPALPAFVRWTAGDESGLAFDSSIPMPIIASWIEGRLRPRGPREDG